MTDIDDDEALANDMARLNMHPDTIRRAKELMADGWTREQAVSYCYRNYGRLAITQARLRGNSR